LNPNISLFSGLACTPRQKEISQLAEELIERFNFKICDNIF
jgi:hypothetical protein